jgi:biopolymer transport protein ExbD
MKTHFIYLLFMVLAAGACRETTSAPPSTESATSQAEKMVTLDDIIVTVDNKGNITLGGEPITLEKLRATLQDRLARMKSLPDDVPVNYGKEVLMGMRGEVETEVNTALRNVKLRYYDPALNVLRAEVEKVLTVPVKLDVTDLRTLNNYIFVSGSMLQPDGKAMDFSKTPLKAGAAEGFVSESVFGLLKRENGNWRLLAKAVGPTDMPVVCWWKDYGAPKALFGAGMAADECQ